jgi:hypothetical protein
VHDGSEKDMQTDVSSWPNAHIQDLSARLDKPTDNKDNNNNNNDNSNGSREDKATRRRLALANDHDSESDAWHYHEWKAHLHRVRGVAKNLNKLGNRRLHYFVPEDDTPYNPSAANCKPAVDEHDERKHGVDSDDLVNLEYDDCDRELGFGNNIINNDNNEPKDGDDFEII